MKNFCNYGCNQEAKFQLKNGKFCCSSHFMKCSYIRKKHSDIEKQSQKSLETKKKRSKSLSKYYSDLNNRKKKSEHMRKPETIKKISESMRKYFSNPLNRKRNSEAQKICQNIVEIKKKKSIAQKQYFSNSNNRMKASELILDLWKDTEYIKKQIKGRSIVPNKPEILLIKLFKELNLNYKFTGDFSFMIDGKNPDFTNHDNKKVIEFFGSFWHGNIFRKDGKSNIEHEQSRISHFAKSGYKTLIIWENELNNINDVIDRLLEFEQQ